MRGPRWRVTTSGRRCQAFPRRTVPSPLFDGGWCLTGDVAFHDPISYAFPQAESVYDTDHALGVRTRLRLLDRLAADRLRIIGYHHPWPGLGRLERTGGTFRFIQGE